MRPGLRKQVESRRKREWYSLAEDFFASSFSQVVLVEIRGKLFPVFLDALLSLSTLSTAATSQRIARPRGDKDGKYGCNLLPKGSWALCL